MLGLLAGIKFFVGYFTNIKGCYTEVVLKGYFKKAKLECFLQLSDKIHLMYGSELEGNS